MTTYGQCGYCDAPTDVLDDDGNCERCAGRFSPLAMHEAMRQTRLLEWCEQKQRWTWLEVPRAWHDTFTTDLRRLRAQGKLTVEHRSCLVHTVVTETKQPYVINTVEYAVNGEFADRLC